MARKRSVCYKTNTDLRDNGRKTDSCGCQNKGEKTEVSIETEITKLSENYGSIYLLTAAIMRNHNLSYEKASEIAERLNSSDYLFDRLIDNILEE